ncbi:MULTISPECIES: Hsp70 family protein [Prochlorococcus]|uniref:Molecular chaperone DnaK n=1 Tax=Prochlorococcus marinus (strain SARG / CCMP1375 / SS120) TaxID=167539 RepID=Q7VA80_PROMA|nr:MULTISPECIES: Hsp70 family protein [Prochlorococcus]AAQ00629.1 Molecular chaperone DnaK [Prochlorococcus marinus subsp. marinus str. CCMP1375]KGG10877.1 Chaperone protein DnaK [Prochlorococcus marinus str. LG]KGG20457.1 Chaperone protein DnaK [Prochlorococcus marinus str. SS2]KGG24126.1 Chaperone protein DnaK [Prochlorococcus marinus str. SS35]KGG31617.1 Chaperone protein DnaK [Prochlorococcus marinus str. SS51]
MTKLRGTLAIDLGSTTTVVAFQAENDHSIKLLDLDPITRVSGEVPSLLLKTFAVPPTYIFGQAAKESELISHDSQNLICDFKRWIGAPKKEVPSNFECSPEEAGELLIKEIWERIPSELEIKKLVLSAPVETYKKYREWLHKVCINLDVPEIALVDEPTAAAIGAEQSGGSKILVIDIGGSTIDMSMVLLEGGEGQAEPIAQLIRFNGKDLEGISNQIIRGATVLGKAGLRLGGRDFDRWILNHLYPNTKQTNYLLDVAEKLKCRLSDKNLIETKKLTEEIFLSSDQAKKELRLSRVELEELLKRKGLFKSLSKLLAQTIAQGRSKGYEVEDLTGVVIVGGGSRIPLIKHWLLNQVGASKLMTPPPIEAVVTGALKLTPGVMIRDVINRGVSLRFWDQRTNNHIWHPLFLPGQPWPTTKPLEIILSASKMNQLEIELKIADNKNNDIQEVIYVDGIPTIKETQETYKPQFSPWENTALVIPLNPPGELGIDCLKLQFTIDNLCQLNVEGIDLRNGAQIVKKNLGVIR